MYKVRAINFGWYRRRHGILLENLPPSKQRLLLENHFLKWIKPDPQTYEIIFKIEDNINVTKVGNKTYWNPYREDFTRKKELVEDSFILDWSCAICTSDIKCKMTSHKKVENYVCTKCQESHNSKNKKIDQRIVDSSKKFLSHCKNLLKKEQTEFMSYVRRSSKR